MIFAVQTAFLIILLCVCCFFPGFFFVRRFRWTPLEKVCASVGLSLTILYLESFIVFVAGGPGSGNRLPVMPFVVSSIVFLALGLASYKDVLRVVRSFRVA